MEIAKIIKDTVGEEVKINRTPSEDNRSYHISSEKIKKELGLYPKKTIEDAVKDLKLAFENNYILDPSDPIYWNIKTMKNLGFGA